MLPGSPRCDQHGSQEACIFSRANTTMQVGWSQQVGSSLGWSSERAQFYVQISRLLQPLLGEVEVATSVEV